MKLDTYQYLLVFLNVEIYITVLQGVLTGNEHGLSKTTMSSSTCINLIGFDNTGVSCL